MAQNFDRKLFVLQEKSEMAPVISQFTKYWVN